MNVKVQIYHVQISDVHCWEKGAEAFEKAFSEKNFDKVSWLEKAEFKEGESYLRLLVEDNFSLAEEQLLELAINNVNFKVLSKTETKVNIAAQIAEMADKPLKLESVNAPSQTFNNTVDVHMPGNLLASYNETMLCEDCCTDNLQAQLTAGWRMIAVCPQPDQRRPDYVLGRFNPELELHVGAKRGA